MPVDKNDVITLPLNTDWALQRVEWRQRLKDREAEYYNVGFTNSKDSSTGLIFIAKENLDEFKNLAHDTNNKEHLTITVSDNFLYGQNNKDGRRRFLVYHDKGRDIFQHRFVQSALQQGFGKAEEIVRKFGYEDVNSIGDMLKGTLGDRLRSFK
ncbi:hypothetical protein BJX62DRAFT_86422 [Aspergillus germanicus]